MNYIDIKYPDIANGPGIRVSLWVMGCEHHCKGCHNPNTWNPKKGRKFTAREIDIILDYLGGKHIEGLTITGGDPLYPDNRDTIAELCWSVRQYYGDDKSIWMWTGYSWEDLYTNKVIEEIEKDTALPPGNINNPDPISSILSCIDVLVDGKYVESLKDVSLPYCGSSNQRVINVQDSLDERNLILL